ncbi:speedy protein E4-like [Fukomys damarensis]|uniref:speedy protein E4-like n=1 Tax=Fukomys damarensis TaxID=885580 RepID=UPI00053FFB68|nr:speedy protein E4-like [Fukomys damarensis]
MAGGALSQSSDSWYGKGRHKVTASDPSGFHRETHQRNAAVDIADCSSWLPVGLYSLPSHPPTSASQELELQACTAMPGPLKKSPGLQGVWIAPRLLPQVCAQKWKRDGSSDSEDESQEDLVGLVTGVPSLAPCFLPPLPVQKKQNASLKDLESEMQQEERPGVGGSDTALRRNLSLSPQSCGHKWKREWPPKAKEDEERGHPQCMDVALREDIRLPPRKRWREYLSLLEKEQQVPLLPLGPVPLTHTGVVEKPYGLKRKMKRKHLSSVLPEHHEAFARLLEDPVIKGFLAWDVNLKASDKNLLAMVVAYFSRAGLFPWQYQRIHFFLALYLANDMEEDNQEPKLHMFFFVCGMNFDKIPQFHKLRYQFIRCMDWNLRVTPEECEEIQAYDPTLWVWGRDRTLIRGPWSPEDIGLKNSGQGSSKAETPQRTPTASEPMVGPWGMSPPLGPSLP